MASVRLALGLLSGEKLGYRDDTWDRMEQSSLNVAYSRE